MKVVKFKSEDEHQKQFVATLRKNVNDYFTSNGISKQGDWRMYLKSIVMLAAYIAPFVVILTVPMNAWFKLILVVLMGIGEAGIGMSVMHDAAHGVFSKNKWVNNFFASTMFILGSNTFNWRIQHNLLHHTFTNIQGFDQDIDQKVIRLCQHDPVKKFHRFQQFYAFFLYRLMTFSKLITDIFQLIDFNKRGITEEQGYSPKGELFKLILTKVLYFSIILGLPIIFLDLSWWQLLIGFMTLHITAGMIMSTVFQMAHVVEGTQQPLPDENGIIHNEWAVHQLQTTSDFGRNNRMMNWYVGGLNFQIEHHLYTNICHIHYPKIAPIVEQTANEYGIDYNQKSTFLSALISHQKRLKELGRSDAV
jgi:linoleoyl-CoA desaturase